MRLKWTSWLRQDVAVSNSAHPVIALPTAVGGAYELVKSPVRLTLVRWLTDYPNSLVSEIVVGIGGHRGPVAVHLAALEAIGAVQTGHALGDRERRHVRYRVNAHRVKALLDTLARFLTDPPVDTFS